MGEVNDQPAWGDDITWGQDQANEVVESNISMVEFEALCEKAWQLKDEKTRLAKQAKEVGHELDELQNTIIQHLKSLGKKTHLTKNGKLTVAQKTSVTLPQGENKEKFFEYLKEKGIFEDMVHVNSRTLQSFYKQEVEAHLADGDVAWEMPGIEEPITFETMRMTKG